MQYSPIHPDTKITSDLSSILLTEAEGYIRGTKQFAIFVDYFLLFGFVSLIHFLRVCELFKLFSSYSLCYLIFRYLVFCRKVGMQEIKGWRV